jgi:hypothetical protein
MLGKNCFGVRRFASALRSPLICCTFESLFRIEKIPVTADFYCADGRSAWWPFAKRNRSPHHGNPYPATRDSLLSPEDDSS